MDEKANMRWLCLQMVYKGQSARAAAQQAEELAKYVIDGIVPEVKADPLPLGPG